MCSYCNGHGTSGTVPTIDKNPEPPAPPADHEPQTPELLQTLIAELNRVRNEKSQLFAEMQRPQNQLGKGSYKSDIEATWERQNKEQALDDKEGELMLQIRQLMHLLPPEKRPRTLGFGLVG